MAGVALRGGPELRARLAAISRPGIEIGRAWQEAATPKIKAGAPMRTGHLKGSIHPGRLTEHTAEVRGDYWGIFIDRGTKEHDITPKTVSGSGRGGPGTSHWLKFEYKGQTIFAKKVHRRRKARRPFITKAAQEALREHSMADSIVKMWNRKRKTQRWSGLK